MSLVGAIRLLTRFYIPGKTNERAEQTLFWFPFVGALLGGISYLIALLPLSALIRSALILSSGVYFTRALHYDGLADFADGLGGGFTKERALEIMRDSHIGAFGTITLILTFLLQFSLLVVLVDYPSALIISPALGRFAQVWAASTMNYAREGEGMASELVRRAKWYHGLLPTLQIGLAVLLLFIVDSPFFGWTLIGLLFVALSTLWVCVVAKKRLGGITGDVLGSVEVLAETAVLLGLALAITLCNT